MDRISLPMGYDWGFRKWSPVSKYIGLSAIYFAVIIGYYVSDPFGFDNPARDTWHHLAVLRELMVSPFYPSNPHIPTDEPSRYFTPLNIIAALIGKTFNLSPVQIFGFTGAAMCVAFCGGCWLFAKRYFRSAQAPAIFLSTLLFAWGTQLGHVGLHNYESFTSSAAYPATQTLVLGLFSWYVCLVALERERNSMRYAGILTLITAATVVSHQFSAFIMLVGSGSFILFHRAASTDRKIILLSAIFCGGLLSLAWPYFNPLDVVLSASDPRWVSPKPQMSNVSLWFIVAAPAFVGIFGFLDRVMNRWRFEIIIPALFFGLSYLILMILDSSIAHRVPPAMILYLQLGICWTILSSGIIDRMDKWHYVILTLIIGLCMAGGSSGRVNELKIRSEFGPMLPSVEKMRAAVSEDAISFATENAVYPFQSTGRRVVSIPRPEPVAPSLLTRQAATDQFFAETTSQQDRYALLQRWKASYIVFARQDVSRQTATALREFGPSQNFVRGLEIITVSTRRSSR